MSTLKCRIVVRESVVDGFQKLVFTVEGKLRIAPFMTVNFESKPICVITQACGKRISQKTINECMRKAEAFAQSEIAKTFALPLTLHPTHIE